MVGLIMNVDEDGDPTIEMEEFEEVYFKLKIYACDDLKSLARDDGDEDNHRRSPFTAPFTVNLDAITSYISRYYDSVRCKTERVQKSSRLIFVWTFGGRGINFLDGHGIHFNVSCNK